MAKPAPHPRQSARPEKQSSAGNAAARGDNLFPVVGIGASAGGLEALELFLGNVPADSGMAFVVIQHLDPAHTSMMPELLQRATRMEVFQARSRLKVKPDCVYVIPPNKDLTILDGTLHLLEPAAPRGLRLPIDLFFRALAKDRRERSVGVILSGMGSDGTLGLRAIKENGGLALAQDPVSAKFDPMPKSAIDSGLADIIAPARELAGRIAEFVLHAPPGGMTRETESAAQKSALDKIFVLLRAHTGHDFSLYKKSTLYRRIERRMALHQIKQIADYVRHVRENPQELDLLFKELLIGVTGFFRDQPAWAVFQEQALPALLAEYPEGRQMRAWVAGCSTGEEAYSLAIVFKEALEKEKTGARATLQIFATDLDPDAINRARQGYYPANIAADVSPERLSRFFVKEGGGYRICKEIREMVVFARQNIIMDPPFSKLEILFCRNLLIYLSPELQKKLLPLFHYCLNPGGILFLGSAESTGGHTGLFTPLETRSRLYRRSNSPARVAEMEFPGRLFPAQPGVPEEPKALPGSASLQTLAEQLLLRQFSPAAVLVNGEGDILYVSGHTGKYLEPAAGKANWNIYAMAREGLRHEIALTLPQALRNKENIIVRGVAVENQGNTQAVDLAVHVIGQPEPLRGMAMIVFADAAATERHVTRRASPGHARSAELERELRLAREELLAARQEIKSANQESQSTREELQSSNEELTSSREEMQSLNEELLTVNVELQSNLDELSREKDDLDNLFNSTDIATVFLDIKLNVRRFTTQAKRLFRLIPGDVGRPLSDIATDLNYPDLAADAREVLRTMASLDRQAATRDGRWLKVRITPYRTLNNMIGGVIITLVDITEIRTLEMELQRMQTISSLIELRDPGTAGHERRVAILACAIAGELGMAQERIHGLQLGGIVHDIGKLRIPAEILGKPSQLTEAERQMIRGHARAGYEILKDIHFPWPVADMVLQHHERLDGSGYPDGLEGEAILLEARILAVADVVEAISAPNSCLAPIGIEPALAEIEKNRGITYDAAVVDACLGLFREKKFSFSP